MSEDQFLKLYTYIQDEFKSTRAEIAEVKEMVGGLQSSVDGYAKQVLDLTQEHLMLSHKVDRIEKWVQKIASEAGVKLDY